MPIEPQWWRRGFRLRIVSSSTSATGSYAAYRRNPSEVPNPIPFAEDRVHKSYDPDQAHRFWRALASAYTLLKEFRSRFVGKCSPVHFFRGSFDPVPGEVGEKRAS